MLFIDYSDPDAFTHLQKCRFWVMLCWVLLFSAKYTFSDTQLWPYGEKII